MAEIRAKCDNCDGSGLYIGFAEPRGTAVMCRGCGGSGCRVIRYEPFEERRRRRGIKRVLLDGGTWFTRTGDEKTISVAEFYAKAPAP